ncbi:bifunctional nuclease family protein [Adlercreutzia sp. ZJ154]|uniref:bifunctional nuclease family protein n=1 Tax=Adlercreutzia sp. ZJ154 TaxID=2709790 RepID=UPI0013ECC384|nr:bifunctional nuclease family protein [Adlercreutzia sp. ZJ154]
MIPLRILTLIFTGPEQPAVLVLEPIEEQHEGCSRIVPIWIGANEAMQLGVAIEHVKLPRPMTHDLFIDAITNLDACVDHVFIPRVEGQTFFAKLVIRQAGRLIELDARPTDALALALREDAPFMIDESVLEQASFPYIFKDDKAKEVELQEFRSFIENISPDDFSQQ